MPPTTETPASNNSAVSALEAATCSSNTGNKTENPVPLQQEEENEKLKNDDESTTKQPKEPTMSKNALKRKRRWEHLQQKKIRRKQQEKQVRHAKALAEGRDLEKEQQEARERTIQGVGHAKRLKLFQDRFHASADSSFGVCFDCSFEDKMTYKEINSLSIQIRHCYGVNKRSKYAVHFSVSSLAGKTLELLEKVCGFPDQWYQRGFQSSSQDVVALHKESDKKLVYLTHDSPNVMESLEDDKIYIIGGLVDRNRYKGLTLERAHSLKLDTARLPLSQYLHLVSTQVLTCNHVFEILLQYREHKDWQKALLAVLPRRKDVQAKSADATE